MAGSARPPDTSLTICGPALDGRGGDVGVHRVDAHRDSLRDKIFDDRHHAIGFDARIDAFGAGPGRFAADVDDRRAVGDEAQAVFDGAVTVEKQASVGEGVGRDVDDAHHLNAHSGRNPMA